jgi:four helix bundle protein
MARGSLSEILNHLVDAFDEKLIPNEILQKFSIQVNEVEKILNGYMSWLKKQSNK